MDDKKLAIELNKVFQNQFEMLKTQKEWKEAIHSSYPKKPVEELIIAWLSSACNNAASVVGLSEPALREDAMQHLDTAKELLKQAGYKLSIAVTKIKGQME